MAEKIRVNVEKIELEVNDDGDIIVIPVSDERFMQRLYKFAEDISKKSEEVKFIDKNDVSRYVQTDMELHELIKSNFNELFGDKAYEKVFGSDILVGAEYVFEFLDQCMPFINAYAEKRQQKLNKYNANRTGSTL